MRLYRQTTKKDGETITAAKWYGDVYLPGGKRVRFPLFASKEDSREFAKKMETMVSQHEEGQSFDKATQRWLSGVSSDMLEKFCNMGLIDSSRIEGGRKIKEHLDDWRAHLIASGVSVKQAELLHSRVERIFSAAGCRRLLNMKADKTLNVINGLAKLVQHKDPKTGGMHNVETGRGVSSLTKKHHMRAVKQFSKWLKTDGRMEGNPLENMTLKGAFVENQRRALTQDEIVYLLDYTANAGTICNLSGPERALIYLLALETGLRASELASLKRTSFDFDGLTVKVEAQNTKNRKAAVLPVKAATMERIKAHLRRKLPGAAAFGLNVAHGAKMIHTDMERARSGWIEAVKDNPAEHRRRDESDFLKIKTDKGKIDFHSLRHTFATFLVQNGTDIKTCQSLLRHSTPAMTLAIYTHSRDENLTAAIDNLPSFEKPEQETKQA